MFWGPARHRPPIIGPRARRPRRARARSLAGGRSASRAARSSVPLAKGPRRRAPGRLERSTHAAGRRRSRDIEAPSRSKCSSACSRYPRGLHAASRPRPNATRGLSSYHARGRPAAPPPPRLFHAPDTVPAPRLCRRARAKQRRRASVPVSPAASPARASTVSYARARPRSAVAAISVQCGCGVRGSASRRPRGVMGRFAPSWSPRSDHLLSKHLYVRARHGSVAGRLHVRLASASGWRGGRARRTSALQPIPPGLRRGTVVGPAFAALAHGDSRPRRRAMRLLDWACEVAGTSSTSVGRAEAIAGVSAACLADDGRPVPEFVAQVPRLSTVEPARPRRAEGRRLGLDRGDDTLGCAARRGRGDRPSC